MFVTLTVLRVRVSVVFIVFREQRNDESELCYAFLFSFYQDKMAEENNADNS